MSKKKIGTCSFFNVFIMRRVRWNPFLLTVFFLISSFPALAQTTYDWLDTAPDANWRQGAGGARWNPGGLWDEPGFGILRFNNNHQLNMNNNVGGTYSQHQIVFGANNTQTRTLGGNPVRLFDFSGNDPKIENLSTNLHIINLSVSGDGDVDDPLEINPVNGDLTVRGAITNNGSPIFVWGDNQKTLNLFGLISGTGGLSVKQDSTVILTNNNTFSGQVSIEAGTLEGRNFAGVLGSGTLSISGASTTLRLRNNTGLNFGRNTTISANTTIASGRLTDGAGVTHTLGTLNIGANTLTVAVGPNVTSGTAGLTFGATTMSGDSIFNVNSGTLLTLGAVGQSGTRTLIKDGPGQLTMSAASTYSGGTTLRNGAILWNVNNALGTSGTVTINDGSTPAGANPYLYRNAAGTLSRPLVVANAGSGNPATIGKENVNGIVVYSGSQTYNKAVRLQNTGTGGSSVLRITGAISGSGAINIVGSGLVRFENAGNSFSGATTVEEGTLQMDGGANRFSSASALTVNSGATFDLNSNDTAVATLAGAGAVTLGSGTLTTDGNGSTTFSGAITGTGGLNKLGSGTLTISGGANTYNGATFISNGTLIVSGSIGSSPTTVRSGATLMGGGTVGNLTIEGLVDPGNSTGARATLNAGAVTLVAGGGMRVDMSSVSGTAGTDWDLIDASGTITVNGSGTFTIYLHGSGTGFNSATPYSWKIMDGTVSGFDAARFDVDASNFAHALDGGSFSVDESSLHLVFTPLATSIPTVTTDPISEITSTTAKGGGEVTDDGGDTVTEQGVVWNTTGAPTTSDNFSTSSLASSTFTNLLTGLTPGQTYYVRAYAINSVGTGYGNEEEFTADCFSSTPTANAATSVSDTNFTANWTGITGATGYQLDVSTNPAFVAASPTTILFQGFEGSGGDNWSITGGAANASTADGSGDTPASQRIRTGSYSWQVINATANLYLTNMSITGYSGREVALRISSTSTTTGNGSDANDFVRIYVALNGDAFPGSPDIELEGFNNARWGYNANLSVITTAGAPVYVQAPQGGTSANNYTLARVVIPDSATSIALRVYAINNAAAEVWNVDDIEVTGFAGDYVPGYESRAVSGSSHVVTGLTQNTTYYYRLRAVGAGSCVSGNSNTQSVTTAVGATLPSLTTDAITGITPTTAVAGGNVTNDGNASVTDRGVVWNTSGTPTDADNKLASGSGTGTFSDTISGLIAGQTYYVRAYASNIVGIAYGNEESFSASCFTSAPIIQAATSIGYTNFTANWSVLAGATGYQIDVSTNATFGILVREDFTDNDFTSDPVWSGDTGSYSVLTDATLPSGNASTDGHFLGSDASVGNSILTTPSTAVDEWRFSLGSADFNPASGNHIGVILMSSAAILGDVTTNNFNGYYLRLGVDGGTDYLELWVSSGTSKTKVGDFTGPGNFGTGALRDGLNLRITRNGSGVFNLYYTTGFTYSSTPTTLGGTLTNNTHSSSSFFGVYTRLANPATFRRVYIDNIQLGAQTFVAGYESREVSGGGTSSLVITGLVDGVEHFYRVRAVGAGGCVSDNSDTENAELLGFNPPGIGIGGGLTPSSTVGNNPANQTFVVTNVGERLLSYMITSNVSWLSISPISGTNLAAGGTQSHTVTYNVTGLSDGVYTGLITITGTGSGGFFPTNSPRIIEVVLTLNAIPNPSVATVTADGNEFIRLAWTKHASYDVMIIYRATNAPTAPTQGAAYSVGDSIGSDGTRVLYKGAANNREHVVVQGAEHFYAFYSYTNNHYSSGIADSDVTGSYFAGEIVEPFAYTNGVTLASRNGGAGWDSAWVGDTGDFVIDGASFAPQVDYPTPRANKVRVTPPDAATRAVRRPLGSEFRDGRIYVSYIMNFQFDGPDKFAGLSLMYDTTEKLFVGEIYGADLRFGIDGTSSGIAMNNGTGNDYIMIMRYDWAAGEAVANIYRIGVDTVPAGEPGSWDITVSKASNVVGWVNGVRLAAGAGSGTPGNVFFDEVRVGTNWTDIIKVAPSKVIYDGFAGSSGSLSGQGGGTGWSDTWVLGGDPFVDYSAGSFNIEKSSYYQPTGNKIVMYGDVDGRWITASRNFLTTFTTGVVYYSWMQNYAFNGVNKYAGIVLMDGSTEKAFVGKVDSADKALGISGSSHNQTSTYDLEHGAGNDYVIVAKYDFSTRVLSATAYKTSDESIAEEPQGYWTVNTTQSVGHITSLTGARFAIGAGAGVQIGYVYMDEVRVGTNWFEVTRKDGEEQAADMARGPAPRLLYVGTNYNPSLNPQGALADITITDYDLANASEPLDIAVLWSNSFGVFMTNSNPSVLNIGSRSGRVNPNWDPVVQDGDDFLSIGYDSFFTNFVGYNGALTVTTYVHEAFNITNSTFDDTYFITMSAENNNMGGGSFAPFNAGDNIPYWRALTVNTALQFFVVDDDPDPPLVSINSLVTPPGWDSFTITNYMFVYTNQWNAFKIGSGTQATNRLFEVTDEFLANLAPANDLQIHFGAWDEYSGLSRTNNPPIGEEDRFTRLTVANWFTNNYTNFDYGRSSQSPVTSMNAATNVWRWITPVDGSTINAMLFAGSNRISATIVDADNDRFGDYLSISNFQFGWLTVIDDDVAPPRIGANALTMMLGGSVISPILEGTNLLAYWNFNNSNFLPTFGDGTLTSGLIVSNAWFAGSIVNRHSDDTEAAGQAFSPEGGAGQTNNGSWFQFEVDMGGHEDLVMTFAARKSGTGFNSNRVSYSLNGGVSFTNFGDEFDPPDSATFSNFTFNFSSITAMTDQKVIIRITVNGATASGGNNRYDNVQFNARPRVYRVTDGQLANVSFGSPFLLSFNVYDERSGIYRGTSTAGGTNMNISIPGLTTNDTVRYDASRSSAGTTSSSSTSVWAFTSFTYDAIGELYGSGTNRRPIRATMSDMDNDRPGDNLWASNRFFGFLHVIDDDVQPPVTNDISYVGVPTTNDVRPFLVVTNGRALPGSGDLIRNFIPRRDGTGTNTTWALTDADLAGNAGNIQFVFGARDVHSGVSRGTTGSTNSVMSFSVGNIIVGNYSLYDAAASTVLSTTNQLLTNVFSFTGGYFTDTMITQLMANIRNPVFVTIPDTDDDRPDDRAVAYSIRVGNLRVEDDDIRGPTVPSAQTPEMPGGSTILFTSFEIAEGWPNAVASGSLWTNTVTSGLGTGVWYGTGYKNFGEAFAGTHKGGYTVNGVGQYFQLPGRENIGRLSLVARLSSGETNRFIEVTRWDGAEWVSHGTNVVTSESYEYLSWEIGYTGNATLRVTRVGANGTPGIYIDSLTLTEESVWVSTTQVAIAWMEAVDDFSGVDEYRLVAPAIGALTPTATNDGVGFSSAVTSGVASILGHQGVLTGFVFAIDNDNDRFNDRSMGNVATVVVRIDTNPPLPALNMRATDASQGILFDSSIDETTEIKIEWTPPAATESEAAGWRQSDSEPLSPWDSYIVTYYEVVDTNGIPASGATTTVLTRTTSGWTNVLHNYAFTNLVLSNLSFDAYYMISIQGRDKAGNVSFATNVVGNTDLFIVTQGVTRVDTDLEVLWKGVDGRDYDVLYIDSPQGFWTGTSNQWSLLQYTNRPVMFDTGAVDRLRPGELTNTTYRFYRVARTGRWSTNQSTRSGSVEIYVTKALNLFPGENWHSLFFVPDTATVAYVFQTNLLPAADNFADATKITWFGSSLGGTTNQSGIATAVVWLANSGNWIWHIGGAGAANDKIVPQREGFLLELPTDADPQSLVLIGLLPTNQIVHTITGGTMQSNAYHILSHHLPVRTAFSNMGFWGSGFARTGMQADEIRILAQGGDGSLKSPKVRIRLNADNTGWEYPQSYPGYPNVNNYIVEPDDAVIIVRRNTNTMYWTNRLYFTPPTKYFTP